MIEDKKIVILLNDSDPFMTKVCQNKFKKEKGWDSLITVDFDEAIKKIESEKPNLVLTELILKSPDKNGFDLLEEIRSNSKFSKTKIVVFTDLNQDTDKKKAKDLGADEYLVKNEMTIRSVMDRIAEMV